MAINIYTDPEALKGDTGTEPEIYACTHCEWTGTGQAYFDESTDKGPLRDKDGFPIMACPDCYHSTRRIR